MPKLLATDPAFTGKYDKKSAEEESETYRNELYRLLSLMFAEGRRSLLVILQGIDASGKDGTIRQIFSGANPQGIRVYSFKTPSEEELSHDYLWRCHRLTPPRGFAAVFNRSYYEEVTTVRVHPELLGERGFLAKDAARIFRERYRQINDFERMLVENGTVVVKFLLHISPEEQGKRLKERLENPEKAWKFSPADLRERKFWDEYRKAFDQMLRYTHSRSAPWHVVPADKKWYRNWYVSRTLVETLSGLGMEYPKLRR